LLLYTPSATISASYLLLPELPFGGRLSVARECELHEPRVAGGSSSVFWCRTLPNPPHPANYQALLGDRERFELSFTQIRWDQSASPRWATTFERADREYRRRERRYLLFWSRWSKIDHPTFSAVRKAHRGRKLVFYCDPPERTRYVDRRIGKSGLTGDETSEPGVQPSPVDSGLLAREENASDLFISRLVRREPPSR